MSQPDFDVYQGMSWTERAQHGVLGVALDWGDRSGKKNRFIDAVHQTAIRRALDATATAYKRALDFGCGGGRLLPLLTGYAAQVYGVDRTQACLDLARGANHVPPDRLVCWRDGALPFADDFFDLVLCVYVLLTGEALDSLSGEMARVCAPGGRVIVLEQADNARGLTLERYRAAFAAAGLQPERAQALRRSRGSKAMALATQPWAPRWLQAAAARSELAAMRGARHGPATPGYYDYLFVLQKV